MATELGQAYVQIIPSAKGIGSSLSSELGDAGTTAGQSFGGKFGAAFSKLGTVGKVAAVGAGVAAGAGVAGKAIWDLSTKAAESADRIDKMSQKIGLSRKAYQEWDYVLSQNGMNIDSMKGGIKTLTGQISKAQSGAGASAEAFARLGISTEQLNTMSREDIFKAAITGLQGVSSETEKAALANQLFGRSGSEMAPLLNQSADSTQNLIDKANDLGLVMGDDAVDAGVELTDTIDTAKRSFSAITTQLGVAVMPIVQKVLDFIIKHMPQIKAVTGTTFKAIGIALKTTFTILKTFYTVGRTVFTGIKNAVQTSVGAVTSRITSMRDRIRSAFASVKSAGDALKLGLRVAFLGMTAPIRNTVRIISGILTKLKNLLNAKFKLNLKLPRVTLKGGKAPWGIGGKGTLPKFNVTWAARGYDEALMANSPTLLGIGDGNGNELVTGERHLRQLIREESGINASSFNRGVSSGVVQIVLDGDIIGQSVIDFVDRQTRIYGASPLTV